MKLINFFQDSNGNLSATRLAFLFWSLGVLLVWIYLSISGHEMAKIDVSVTTIIAILMTGKVAQSFSPSENTGANASVNTGANAGTNPTVSSVTPNVAGSR